MEIAPRIHALPVAGAAFMAMQAPNVYLVAGEMGGLIDSGTADEGAVQSRLEYVRGLAPLKLAYILVSHPHPDHIGCARRIREETAARILLHPLAVAEARAQSVAVDGLLNDGETVDVGGAVLQAIHTPGHSPGHLCFYWEQERVLFSGDNVLGLGTTVVQPPDGDMAHYIESLRRLVNLEVRLICPGHGPLIRDPRRKLEELIAHRLEREQQVLGCLRDGVTAIPEMVAVIYPELDQRLIPWANSQVLAHLLKLEREGRAAPVGGGDYALR